MTNLKKMVPFFYASLIVICIVTVSSCTSTAKVSQQSDVSSIVKTGVLVRFEHIAFHVLDPVATAKWYTDNLGMKIVRVDGNPINIVFVADSITHMMVEFFRATNYPLFEPTKINPMSLHLAFSTPNIVETQKKLVDGGATIIDSLRKTVSGDQVLMLRDPWGLPLQFAERVKPMISFTGLFIEHLAINVADSRARAKWYGENLLTVIVRDGKPPTYGMFIADSGRNVMFELYQQEYPVIDFAGVSHMSFHIAYIVDDVLAAQKALVTAGATVVEEGTKSASGDIVGMVRDPWGVPIQLVKREKPMLK